MRCTILSLTAILLPGCLINTDLYEKRRTELSDADGDGFALQDECDDGDAAVHPGATELCDGVDQDCDGEVDEDAADAPTWYVDTDGDGFGDPDERVMACAAPSGFVADANDCDDRDPASHPGATDTPYDGVDQDCTGQDVTDVDGDGYPGGTGGADCDDVDAAVHPTADETWADGLTDNDCDGQREPIVENFGSDAWLGPHAGANAGRRLAAAGDVDGDGVDSLLVASLFDAGAHPNGGAVYLVSGAPGGPLASHPALLADGEDHYLGASVAGGTDVDGDGLPDVAVSATGVDEGTGAAWFVPGTALARSQPISAVALATVRGDAPGGFLGATLAFLGDITGDGLEEVGVAAPYADGAFEDAGRVGIWDTSTLVDARLAEAPVLIEGNEAGATIGNTLESAGDIDGDGYADLLVSTGGSTLAVVLRGGPGGVDADAPMFRLLAYEGTPSADVRMLGDIDGDGARDLGAITTDLLLFTALAGTPTRTVGEPSGTIRVGADSYIYDALDLGDRDGDGAAELLVPSQWYGPYGTAVLGIFSGRDLVFGVDVALDDGLLQARSVRPTSGFGYRAVLAGDLDGDGRDEIALGGFTDDQAGEDAGAATTLVVPQ